MANMEVFDSYFRRADLDQDGRISGAEAVAFFQGSNLPKQTLAQVWMHADQNRTGFLGRAEFYNALKLVTVAQSGRELTPDIVKAALYGPAAAKIPAPRINPMPSPASQANPMALPPQKSMGPPSVPQNFGIRGMQALPNAGMNQQSFPSPDNQFMRPIQATSTALPMQGVVSQGLPGTVNAVGSSFTNLNISNDLSGVRPAGASMTGTSTAPSHGISPSMTQDGFGRGGSIGATAGVPNRAAAPMTQEGFGLGSGLTQPPRPQTQSFPSSSVPNKPQDASLSSLQPAARDLKTSSTSGNGFSPDSFFGGDVFSVSASQLRHDVPASSVSATMTANSSAVTPVAAGPQYSSGTVPPSTGPQYSSAIAPAATGPQSSITPAATGPQSQYSSATVPAAAGPQSSIKQSQVDPFQAFAMTGSGSQLQQTASLGVQSQVNSVQRASALAAAGVSVGNTASASSESQTSWPRMNQSDIQKYMKVFAAVDTNRDGRITGEEARNLFLSWRLPREVLKQVWDLSDQDNDSMLSLREFCTALYLMERYREGHSLPGVLPDSIKFDKILLAITGPPAPPTYGSAAWQPTPGFPQAGVSGVRGVMSGSGLRPTAEGTMFRMDGAARPLPQKSGMPVMEKSIGNQISKEEQKALNSNLLEADKQNEDSQKDILDSKEKIAFYRTMMQELVLYKSRCDNRLNEITERASADKREAELLAKKYEEKYKQVGETASKLTMEEARFRDLQERKMELRNAILNMEQGGSADGLLQVRADRIQSDLEELGKALNDRCKRHGLNVKSTTIIELPFGWQPGIQEGAAHWDEDWDKFEDEGFMVARDITTDVNHNTASSRANPLLVQRDEIMEDGFGVTSSLYNDSKMDTLSSTVARAAESSSAFDHSEDDLVRSPSGSPTPSRRSADSSRDFTAAHFGQNVGADASPRAKETQSDHGGAESTVSADNYDESSWGATFDANDDVDSVWGFNSVKTKDHEHERNQESSFFGSSDFGLNPIRTGSPNVERTFQKKSSVFADSIPNTPLFNTNSPARYSEASEDHTDHFTRFDSFHTSDGGFFPQESLTRFDSIQSNRDSDQNRGHESLARFDSIRSTRDSEHSHGFSFDDSDPFGLNAPFKSSESRSPRKGSDSWSAF